MLKTLFLPGSTGSAALWRPVADHAGLDGVFFAWPGLGAEPAQAGINSIDDLTRLVAAEITEPVAIVAQSMGGVIAIQLALQFPALVRSLVLAVTSGGVPVAELGGEDWRGDYFASYPFAARWIAEPVADLSARIPSIRSPTLLLWGDADPVSPIAVGEKLRSLLPSARLRVFAGAGHDLAQSHYQAVAVEITRHLRATS